MPTSPSWYLLKAEDGTIFGPVPFEQLTAWSASAQISPLDKISSDQVTWLKSPMLPELHMDWLVELSPEQLYGPTTVGAVQEFLNLGEITAETTLINARDGTTATVRDVEGLTIPEDEPDVAEIDGEPVRSGIRASLQQRIRQLESTLLEERKALESMEERYSKLEAKYVEMVKQRP
jgi:hypothetical protein